MARPLSDQKSTTLPVTRTLDLPFPVRLAFEFTFAGKPQAKERPRLGRGNTVYTPRSTQEAEARLARFAEQLVAYKRARQFAGVPLFVQYIFLLERPRSNKSPFPIVRPDCDNMEKLVNDALNCVIWDDDSCIIGGMPVKLWSPDGRPRTIIRVYEVVLDGEGDK